MSCESSESSGQASEAENATQALHYLLLQHTIHHIHHLLGRFLPTTPTLPPLRRRKHPYLTKTSPNLTKKIPPSPSSSDHPPHDILGHIQSPQPLVIGIPPSRPAHSPSLFSPNLVEIYAACTRRAATSPPKQQIGQQRLNLSRS